MKGSIGLMVFECTNLFDAGMIELLKLYIFLSKFLQLNQSYFYQMNFLFPLIPIQ